MASLPLWAKTFLAFDAVWTRVENVYAGVRDELFLALVPAEDRVRMTVALYARQRTYLPGGNRFDNGLFKWEEKTFAHDQFPRSGRVLVGAAGAGREAIGLLERGYEVAAFDPCDAFVDAGKAIVARFPRALMLRGEYGDLEPAVQGTGPLAELMAPGMPAFDAVVLGWGSLSHLAPFAARAKLFRDVRALAPRAVILTSFAIEDAPPSETPPVGPNGEVQGSKGRVRDALRWAFTQVGAPGVSATGDHFYPDAGFLTSLYPDELVRLAWQAGYEVAFFEEGPYPHALLVPMPVK